MTTRNLILGFLIIPCVTWGLSGCSSKSSAGGPTGCAESVTLMSPNNTNILTHECQVEQKVHSQIAPNNSVVMTCSCPDPKPDAGDAGTD